MAVCLGRICSVVCWRNALFVLNILLAFLDWLSFVHQVIPDLYSALNWRWQVRTGKALQVLTAKLGILDVILAN